MKLTVQENERPAGQRSAAPVEAERAQSGDQDSEDEFLAQVQSTDKP